MMDFRSDSDLAALLFWFLSAWAIGLGLTYSIPVISAIAATAATVLVTVCCAFFVVTLVVTFYNAKFPSGLLDSLARHLLSLPAVGPVTADDDPLPALRAEIVALQKEVAALSAKVTELSAPAFLNLGPFEPSASLRLITQFKNDVQRAVDHNSVSVLEHTRKSEGRLRAEMIGLHAELDEAKVQETLHTEIAELRGRLEEVESQKALKAGMAELHSKLTGMESNRVLRTKMSEFGSRLTEVENGKRLRAEISELRARLEKTETHGTLPAEIAELRMRMDNGEVDELLRLEIAILQDRVTKLEGGVGDMEFGTGQEFEFSFGDASVV